MVWLLRNCNSRDTDDGNFVIKKGGKVFNTLGYDPKTKYIILFARTNQDVPAAKGISAFIVQIRDDDGNPLEGIQINKQKNMMGHRGTETAQFFFDEGTVIPTENLL